jgi:hypothetical protein
MSARLESHPVEVLTDGGSSGGRLVLAEGKLVAVLVRVEGGETGEPGSAGGWYVEAGFGPCGILMTLPPQVFPEEAEAMAWIGQQLERRAAGAVRPG